MVPQLRHAAALQVLKQVAFDMAVHVDLQERLGDGPAAATSTPEPLLKRLVHTELSPQQVVLRDKFGFVAGIGNIA